MTLYFGSYGKCTILLIESFAILCTFILHEYDLALGIEVVGFDYIFNYSY